MKRNIAISAFVGLVCSATAAFATEVYTPNTVGYIRVDLTANQWTLAGVAFDQFGEGVSIADVLGTGLPNGTRVMVWDTAALGYKSADLVTGMQGVPDGWYGDQIIMPRGRGFWIRPPVETELFVLGQVPQEDQADLDLKEGLQLFTSPFPVPVDMNDVQIFETEPTPGDRLIKFDTGGYISVDYAAGQWWGDVVLQPGQGYWYRSRADQVIVVRKPYE